MTDIFLPQKRSQIMSSVGSYDTLPERQVRSLVHGLGYRFRIRQNQLPGNPDIVLPKHMKVIFIHGCFWHGHKNCRRAKRPETNTAFWTLKLDKNIVRDIRQQKELKKLGWKSLVVWQCEIRNRDKLRNKILRFLDVNN